MMGYRLIGFRSYLPRLPEHVGFVWVAEGMWPVCRPTNFIIFEEPRRDPQRQGPFNNDHFRQELWFSILNRFRINSKSSQRTSFRSGGPEGHTSIRFRMDSGAVEGRTLRLLKEIVVVGCLSQSGLF